MLKPTNVNTKFIDNVVVSNCPYPWPGAH